MFVTSQGHPYVQFQRALERGNVLQALALAHELPRLTLEDALRLCVLLAEKDRPRYERAAVRWLGRLALKRKGLTLAEAQLAVAALGSLPSPAATAALRELSAPAAGRSPRAGAAEPSPR